MPLTSHLLSEVILQVDPCNRSPRDTLCQAKVSPSLDCYSWTHGPYEWPKINGFPWGLVIKPLNVCGDILGPFQCALLIFAAASFLCVDINISSTTTRRHCSSFGSKSIFMLEHLKRILAQRTMACFNGCFAMADSAAHHLSRSNQSNGQGLSGLRGA